MLAAMDSPASGPLAGLIALLRPRTVFSKIVSGAGQWSIRYERYEDPGFCVVLAGSCYLDAGPAGVFPLREGDFVLLPEVPGFTLASDLELAPALVLPTTAETRHGDGAGPATMRMLGGYFRFDRANAQLLVRLLPAVVHVRRDEEGAARLRRIVELIAEEAGAERPGRDLILERLVEVLLVEALRYRSAQAPKQDQGLLAGLADPGLARPLREIHADVARRWTVGQLARCAGMSRAVFAERFARKVGLPPMQYLLEWRMAVAKDLLRRERSSLAELADRVGYQSASSFSTAFTRHVGVPPSEYARQQSCERLKSWFDEQQAASLAEGIEQGRAEGVKQGRADGVKEGRADGQRSLLAKQLKLKFGPLDAATEARLAGATSAQMSRWAERVLSAGSLDEIWG